jgi:hypothetical protein
VQEWKRLKILCLLPGNFETEQEAVEAIRMLLEARRVRTDLAQRVFNGKASIRQIADAAGLAESHVRRIADGMERPSDTVVLLLSSALDSLRAQEQGTKAPTGV